ncbi:MAG: DUF4189 domain-containing protein [Rhodanobacter sp.]
MMKLVSWLSLISLSLLFHGTALAEGNCPPGYYPIGAPQGQGGPQSCAPIPGYNQDQGQLPAQPPPQWSRRWGAIMTDAPKGILGTATNMISRGEAGRNARADCLAKGGTQCKLQLAYDNECAVMVLGDKAFNVTAAATIDEAARSGIKQCSVDSDNCHIYYSACSLPVQIQ